ncbi:MAG: hypothetical protein QHJ73_16575, partial [Armatimonadota bacterium]|nr:hypothetical protein [Armatimonadota bacterium]
MAQRGEPRLSRGLPGFVPVVTEKLASFALVPVVATFLYLLYALFSGYVRDYPILTQAHQLKVLYNLEVASHIFLAAAVFWVIYVLVHLWESHSLAAALVGIGGALYFGTPFLIARFIGGAMGDNAAAATVQGAFTNTGIAALMGGVLRAVPELAEQLRSGFGRLAQEGTVRRAAVQQVKGLVHPFSPCWRLPYCQRYIRDYCPRYTERRTCWRKKAGCMCDDSITTAALLASGGSSSAAKERLILEYLPGAGEVRRLVSRRVTCHNCFIYLEHQRVKHKWIAPVAVPLVLAVFYFGMPLIDVYYLEAGKWATSAVQAIALGTVDTQLLMETFTSPLVKWLAVIAIYM